MKNAEGTKIPAIKFLARENGDWVSYSSEKLFKGKRVVVFELPGAFTPTCSSSHLPRYDELTPLLKENGIDDVICASVNDGFVMEAWGKDQGLKNVRLLPDGNGELAEAVGMMVDKSDIGFGKRSWRYSMVVNDGVVEKMFVEPDKPGDPFEVSDADTMLNFVNPSAKLPAEVTIITKPGCPFCAAAKKDLREHGLNFEEIELGAGVSFASVRNLSGKSTAPQIFIDGKHIGGSEELAAFLKAK